MLPDLTEMRRTLDSQTRWNLAAQEVLEREIADEQAREGDEEWQANASLREEALGRAFEILDGVNVSDEW